MDLFFIANIVLIHPTCPRTAQSLLYTVGEKNH